MKCSILPRCMATGRYLHPPLVIFAMLFGLALPSSVLAGYIMADDRQRHWIHVLAFAATTAGTVYMILDIEYPRLGLIRVDIVNQVLMDVRKSMD
ncbi:MAG: hypothetical protein ACXWAT_11005 [Methylobacter sp.]